MHRSAIHVTRDYELCIMNCELKKYRFVLTNDRIVLVGNFERIACLTYLTKTRYFFVENT